MALPSALTAVFSLGVLGAEDSPGASQGSLKSHTNVAKSTDQKPFVNQVIFVCASEIHL